MGTSGHRSLTSNIKLVPLNHLINNAGMPTERGVDVAYTKSTSDWRSPMIEERTINLKKDHNRDATLMSLLYRFLTEMTKIPSIFFRSINLPSPPLLLVKT